MPRDQRQGLTERLFTFVGGATGAWRILRTEAVLGEPLAAAARLAIHNALVVGPSADARWVLRGVTSNERYVNNEERQLLAAKQPPLGRPEAVLAALIPIRKSDAWWSLTQEDRREIFETSSGHIKAGLTVLPAVARRLHHSRDLGESFDFLTWFEYAPGDSAAFEELVLGLRATEEWKYVDREVDIRVVRDPTA